MSLRTYTRVAAAVFVFFGLVGFAASAVGYSGYFTPAVPENLMHVIVGLLYAYFGFWRTDHVTSRDFVGGMGVLLLLGKAVLIGGNLWGARSFLGTVTEGLCVVLGVSSILAAWLLPDAEGPQTGARRPWWVRWFGG